MFIHHEEPISYLVDSKYSISDDAVTINGIIPIITLAEVSQSVVAGACNKTLHLSRWKAENRSEVGQAITSRHTSSWEALPKVPQTTETVPPAGHHTFKTMSLQVTSEL